MKIPEQYRTGVAYFMDFEFKVSPDTFIPRPETELLVEKVIETAKKLLAIHDARYAIHILDIGTGSGNIAISLTKYLPQSKITALDISRKALLKAKENAKALGVEKGIEFIQSDLLENLEENGLFDIVVTNPPYISQADMESLDELVRAEPEAALCGGPDGLVFYRDIARNIPRHLKNNGYVLMEIGCDQGREVPRILESNGFTDIEVFKDYRGIDRIVKAILGKRS